VKRAEQVALQIEADIMAANWPLGTSMGSEAELQQRYGLSRAVLREAIRLVEHHGAAITRRGPSGGLIVTAPDPRNAATAAVVYLEYAGATLDDLVEARLLLEPLAAALAADHISEQGVATLRRTVAQGYTREDAGPGRSLHTALGHASGNTVLEVFIEILVRLSRRYSHSISELEQLLEQEDSTSNPDHVRIAEAVAAGDGVAARQLMLTRLEHLRDAFGETGRLKEQLRHLSPQGPPPSMVDGRMKLAETIAYQVRRRFLDEDLSPGHWLGSETEMIEEYGVSRAVLREAIRLLEWYSVVSTQRGPGGGIRVATPSPDAGVDTIALYLDYRDTGIDDLAAIRAAIELGCIDKVCSRHNEPAVRARLESALRVGLDTPRADLNLLGNHLHIELCDLSGNPVLAMLSRILTALWARFNANPLEKTGVTDDQVVQDISRTHGLIVEAVLAGDHALARHRMSRHLSALSDWWH
jgi:DNA-binding FadR family transcriptional regulator